MSFRLFHVTIVLPNKLETRALHLRKLMGAEIYYLIVEAVSMQKCHASYFYIYAFYLIH